MATYRGANTRNKLQEMTPQQLEAMLQAKYKERADEIEAALEAARRERYAKLQRDMAVVRDFASGVSSAEIAERLVLGVTGAGSVIPNIVRSFIA